MCCLYLNGWYRVLLYLHMIHLKDGNVRHWWYLLCCATETTSVHGRLYIVKCKNLTWTTARGRFENRMLNSYMIFRSPLCAFRPSRMSVREIQLYSREYNVVKCITLYMSTRRFVSCYFLYYYCYYYVLVKTNKKKKNKILM